MKDNEIHLHHAIIRCKDAIDALSMAVSAVHVAGLEHTEAESQTLNDTIQLLVAHTRALSDNLYEPEPSSPWKPLVVRAGPPRPDHCYIHPIPR